MADRVREMIERLHHDEQGHAYGWGGGGIVFIILLVVLLLLIF